MIDAGSFRDPSGYVFVNNNTVYRGINPGYRIHYEKLMTSGLYQELVNEKLLIPHEEVTLPEARYQVYYKIIRPVQIPFISYPYEWSFSQFRDAALTTLHIQQKALEHGMILKDANGFNIQFYEGRPVLIDTLSFEIYEEHTPWDAYRQFCEHFVAPLVLMSNIDPRMGVLMRDYINGFPLDLAVKLLPFRKKINPGVYMHLVLHARLQKKYAAGLPEEKKEKKNVFTSNSLKRMAKGLELMLAGLSLNKDATEWGDYYETGIEHEDYLGDKERIINSYLDGMTGECWDLGANDTKFSMLAAGRGMQVVAFDSDHTCIENAYRMVRKSNTTNLLPLIMDLTNPSPGLGWFNAERKALFRDGNKPQLVMALALIHHLVISNNIPLHKLAAFFAEISEKLIIEFVPKSDQKVKFLLANRRDIFTDYTEENFRTAFEKHFRILRSDKIAGSDRVLFLMEK